MPKIDFIMLCTALVGTVAGLCWVLLVPRRRMLASASAPSPARLVLRAGKTLIPLMFVVVLGISVFTIHRPTSTKEDVADLQARLDAVATQLAILEKTNDVPSQSPSRAGGPNSDARNSSVDAQLLATLNMGTAQSAQQLANVTKTLETVAVSQQSMHTDQLRLLQSLQQIQEEIDGLKITVDGCVKDGGLRKESFDEVESDSGVAGAAVQNRWHASDNATLNSLRRDVLGNVHFGRGTASSNKDCHPTRTGNCDRIRTQITCVSCGTPRSGNIPFPTAPAYVPPRASVACPCK